jgi:hypothetical protein
MRPSQIAMLAAIGLVMAVLLATAAWIALSAALGDDVPEALWKEQRTRSVTLDGFTGVEVRGQWEVTIERGDTWAVELSYPAAAENRASAQIEDQRLLIGTFTTGFWTHFGEREGLKMTAHVTMPSLETLSVSGAAKVTFSGFEGPRLGVTASGATNLRGASSRYRDLDLVLSGAGSIDLSDVVGTNANVVLSGVGSVRLRLDGGVLKGTASGAGSIEYSGTVSEERIDKSGAVGIRHTN